MTRDHIDRLADAFASEYTDREIDVRLFFDRWADRQRLAASQAERLWRKVAGAPARGGLGLRAPGR